MYAHLLIALAMSAVAAPAQDPWWAGHRTPLTEADYGRFERLGAVVPAPDGGWAAWTITRVDGDRSVRLRRLGAGGPDGEIQEFEHASRPEFSDDGRWLAFVVGVSEAEREKLAKREQPVPSKAGLVDLTTGERTDIDGVSALRFSADGRFVALRRTKPKGSEDRGSTLIVRGLGDGRHTTFGHVTTHAWSDDGHLLAYAIETHDRVGDGVFVLDPETGVLRCLDASEARYRDLIWRDDGFDLAALRRIETDEDDDETEAEPDAEEGDGDAQREPPDTKDADRHPAHDVLTWRGLDGDEPGATVFTPAEHEAFPDGFRIVAHQGLRWHDDGRAVCFGIRLDPESPTAADRGPKGGVRAELKDPPGVEVWHAKDVDIIPRQKKTLQRDRNESHLAALWLDDLRFVRLGDDTTPDVQLIERGAFALGLDNGPYEIEKRFGPTLNDVWLIDTSSGDRKRILQRNKVRLRASPDGRFVAYLDDDAIWTYDIESGARRNLTGDLDAEFINDERQVLTDEKPPYGIAGWHEDGSRLYLHSRWDLWALAPDGSTAERLTDGAADRVRYRRTFAEPDADDPLEVEADEPIWLSVYGDRTKESGFARVAADGSGSRRLRWVPRSCTGLVLANDADVALWIEQAFDDSPDVFTSDATFEDDGAVHQVSATNPFMDEFSWGRAELVDFENAHGEPLQGALFYPSNFEPGTRFPMITYIYERRSQQLHRWVAPSERSAYDPTVWTSQGYFVFQPDIVYRAQNPGLSAVECVVPAVETVLERGEVDPERVGIVGHSWGVYQTAFLVTHTDVFAAGVAGAPLTNMISMSMSVYWNSGQTNAHIFHESQGRMDRPFWQDLDTYVANSPIFGIEQLTAPLLVAFGDDDGAVDWQQGVEMYNAARLAQKPLVMLVYPGENHGLRKKENQVDYHHRVRAWFDHHLKGTPAPGWITDGRDWLEQLDEREAWRRSQPDRPTPRPPRNPDSGR